MHKTFSILFFFFFSIITHSQGLKFNPGSCLYASGGYVYQKEHVFESSGPVYNFSNEKNSIGIGPSVQFTYYQKRLYVPFGGVLQYRYKTGEDSGITLDVMYHFRNTFKEKLHLITPQIGFCFKHLYIRCGYNITLDNNLYPWVSKNKFSLMYRIKP